ncbi:MAG: PilT/PilU family type 4a pilus ATPase [Candidatus Pacebacteria bacterium]|nr:PilT/PilU family type 4a pilus ATPase [Candidatus Paceibacterota bacterium]
MDYKSELNELILTLVKEQGSDLHLIAGAPPAIRINSDLITLVHKGSLKSEDTVGFLRSMVSERMFNDFILKQEIDFSFEHLGEYRMRGNAYFEKGLVGIALRLVPKPKNFGELNLPPILSEIAHAKQGLFLVVGPVRQGKSTTLATLVNEINATERKHIITIEDPIEYIFENDKAIIDQREVGTDTASFNIALKQALRQDIDVIMLGEMRDLETIGAAITAAETGHFVISTLHTNSASQTINRIIDSFPNGQQGQIRQQLSTSLIGIFSQRLIPSTTGGMVPVFELLINNVAVGNLIRDDRVHELDLIIETGREQGMIDFNRNLADLVRAGKVSLDVAMANSRNPRALQKMI